MDDCGHAVHGGGQSLQSPNQPYRAAIVCRAYPINTMPIGTPYRLLPREDVSVSLAERLADRLDRRAARSRARARARAHDELLAEGESHPRTRRRPDRQGQAGKAAGTWMWVCGRVNGWVRTVDGCLVFF
jgi:hypothetical protein